MNFSGTRNSTSANSLNPTSGGDEGVQGRMSALSLGGSGNVGARSLKYVYDLPYFERKELCRILDENNQWEALGAFAIWRSSQSRFSPIKLISNYPFQVEV